MERFNVRLDAQELREKFFSCQGRLNRKPFIMRLLGAIVISTIVAIIFYTLFYSVLGSKQVADGAAIVISIIEVIAIYTLVVRRLHALGMGQPLAVLYLVIAILQPFFFRLITELPEDSMEAQVVQGLNLFTMLLIVCLMMIRGKRGPNQYGDDPLQKR